MKIAESIIPTLMALLGLWLCWGYASEGKAVLATAWAAISVVNGSTALLRGVIVWMERD